MPAGGLGRPLEEHQEAELTKRPLCHKKKGADHTIRAFSFQAHEWVLTA